jgi:CRISPR/Cas system-associated exonuclease Cas4 (RecB family)
MIITHSSLQCFQSCRQKYKLRYLDGIIPREKSDALDFGTHMHELLETYFKHIEANQTFQSNSDEDESIIGMLGSKADKMNLSPIESAKLMGLMYGYQRKYYASDVNEFEVVDVEKEFSVTTPFEGVLIAGKADGILRSKSDGRYYILEHKTASNVDDAYIAQKDIDSQTMTYALCLEQEMGIEIYGVIHDIIIKQKIRQKKGETEEEFCERLLEEVTDDNFERITVVFDRDRLAEFNDELLASCEDVKNCHRFYKCTGNCLGRFGACDYLPLCRAGGLVESVKNLYDTRHAHEELSAATRGENSTDVVSV